MGKSLAGDTFRLIFLRSQFAAASRTVIDCRSLFGLLSKEAGDAL